MPLIKTLKFNSSPFEEVDQESGPFLSRALGPINKSTETHTAGRQPKFYLEEEAELDEEVKAHMLGSSVSSGVLCCGAGDVDEGRALVGTF